MAKLWRKNRTTQVSFFSFVQFNGRRAIQVAEVGEARVDVVAVGSQTFQFVFDVAAVVGVPFRVQLAHGLQTVAGQRLETLASDRVVLHVVPDGRGAHVRPAHQRIVEHAVPGAWLHQLFAVLHYRFLSEKRNICQVLQASSLRQ